MKRRVIQLVLLLIAGAIVNVAVAWGCVWAQPFRDGIGVSDLSAFSTSVGGPSVIQVVSGLPFRAMHGRAAYKLGVELIDGMIISDRFSLPVYPLWPGFAINTVFYAAILWVLFFVPGLVKRTLRRRRDLCPACAYPVRTSKVCTECGKQLA